MSQSLQASEALAPASPLKPRGSPPTPKARDETRRRAVTACTACQQKKTKCSGGDPCSACESRSSQCSYDITSDKRRKISRYKDMEELERKEDELRRHRLLLGGLLAIMRSGDSNTIQHIISVIRRDNDLSNLRSLVESTIVMRPELHRQIEIPTMDNSSVSPGASPSTSIPSDQRFTYDFVMSAPITVDAEPWTSLAGSETVSHLLSVFFTWEHPFYQFIDKSMFLIGYKSYDTSHTFCSKLLVHAILAVACLISGRPQCKALQNKIFDEARLHLEIELGLASIPSLQALLLMHQFEGNRARDRIGRVYRHQAMDTYRRLGYMHATSRPDGSSHEEWRAITTVIWGVFAVDSLTSFLYGFSPAIRPPVVERYFAADAREDLDDRDGDWSPYPLIRSLKQGHFSLIQNAICDLAIIYHEINLLNDLMEMPDSDETKVQRRVEIFQRLEAYDKGLGPKLHLDGEESVPYVYYLHSLRHLAYIILLRPVQELHDLNLGNIDDHVFRHARASLEILWKARSLYTFKYSPTIALICPVVVAYTLIAHLSKTPSVHPVFTRACQAIHEHRDNFPVAHFLLAGLTLLARQYDVYLTEEDRSYLDKIDLPPNVLKSLPMDMPILLDIGDNVQQRGKLDFDSMGDFLTKFSSVALQENLNERSPCDISTPEGAAGVVTAAVTHLAGLDIVHNNASAFAWDTVVDMNPEHWNRVFHAGFDGTFYICRAAIPEMRKRGGLCRYV